MGFFNRYRAYREAGIPWWDAIFLAFDPTNAILLGTLVFMAILVIFHFFMDPNVLRR